MLIQAKDRTGSNKQVIYDEKPDYCPICSYGISPVETNLQLVTIGKRLEIVFRCPRQDCDHLFIARYGYKKLLRKTFISFL